MSVALDLDTWMTQLSLSGPSLSRHVTCSAEEKVSPSPNMACKEEEAAEPGEGGLFERAISVVRLASAGCRWLALPRATYVGRN